MILSELLFLAATVGTAISIHSLNLRPLRSGEIIHRRMVVTSTPPLTKLRTFSRMLRTISAIVSTYDFWLGFPAMPQMRTAFLNMFLIHGLAIGACLLRICRTLSSLRGSKFLFMMNIIRPY